MQLSVINNDRSLTGPKLNTNTNGSHINAHTISECHIEHKQMWNNVAPVNTGTHESANRTLSIPAHWCLITIICTKSVFSKKYTRLCQNRFHALTEVLSVIDNMLVLITHLDNGYMCVIHSAAQTYVIK